MSYIKHSLGRSEHLLYRARFPWFYHAGGWGALLALLVGVKRALSASGRHVLLLNVDDRRSDDRAYLDIALQHQLDGVVIQVEQLGPGCAADEGAHQDRARRRPAGELHAGERDGQHLVGPRARTMWVSTFHSMCVRLLRAESKAIGVKSSFSIYDADDSKRLMTMVGRELDLDPKRYPARSLLAQVSNLKNELVTADAAKAQGNAAKEYQQSIVREWQLRRVENLIAIKQYPRVQQIEERLAGYVRSTYKAKTLARWQTSDFYDVARPLRIDAVGAFGVGSFLLAKGEIAAGLPFIIDDIQHS